jgi:RNA recognition motif-containing protein
LQEIFRAQRALRKKGGGIKDEDKRVPAVQAMKEESVAVASTPVISECVLLQGLPISVNNREILDFFSDVGLIPQHVHIMQNDAGVPMGDAFCEFRTPIEGVRALSKHKTVLGNKEITAKAVTRHDMEISLNMPKKMLPQQQQQMHQQQPPVMMPRNGGVGGHPMRPPHFMGRPPFEPRNQFPMRGPFPPRGAMPPHMMGMRQRPPFPGPNLGPGIGMNGPPPPVEPSVDNFGKPGCVVEVTNVPYQAEVDEILEFFAEFELTRQNVIRRFSDMGKPTGDVRVAFNNPQDAQRAINLKFKKIRERQIYLNLLS